MQVALPEEGHFLGREVNSREVGKKLGSCQSREAATAGYGCLGRIVAEQGVADKESFMATKDLS